MYRMNQWNRMMSHNNNNNNNSFLRRVQFQEEEGSTRTAASSSSSLLISKAGIVLTKEEENNNDLLVSKVTKSIASPYFGENIDENEGSITLLDNNYYGDDDDGNDEEENDEEDELFTDKTTIAEEETFNFGDKIYVTPCQWQLSSVNDVVALVREPPGCVEGETIEELRPTDAPSKAPAPPPSSSSVVTSAPTIVDGNSAPSEGSAPSSPSSSVTNAPTIVDGNEGGGVTTTMAPTIIATIDPTEGDDPTETPITIVDDPTVAPTASAPTIESSPPPVDVVRVTSYICPITSTATVVEEENGTTETTTTALEPREVIIPFDYEMVLDEAANVQETLQSLEHVYLQQMADTAGVLDCASATARNGLFRNRWLQQQNDQNLVVGITGEPADQPDSDNVSCVVPVPSSAKEGSQCVPMNGGVTVLVHPDATASQEEQIQSDMLDVVRQGMLNDDFLANGAIKKVSFIGTRLTVDDNAGGVRGTTNTAPPSDDGLPSWAIGLFIAAGVMVLAAIVVFFAVRHKRRRQHASLVEDAIFVDATIGNSNQYNEELQADPIFEADPVLGGGAQSSASPPRSSSSKRAAAAAAMQTNTSTASDDDDDEEEDGNSSTEGVLVGNRVAEMDEYESFEDANFTPEPQSQQQQEEQPDVIDQLHSISEETDEGSEPTFQNYEDASEDGSHAMSDGGGGGDVRQIV
mmetsp:Transcript_5486/g.8640  ORF Transcript_5486/g.8640 Transcript_5486/m.8640 type:complete len:693 (+) Transcript_5486:178-2256(+)